MKALSRKCTAFLLIPHPAADARADAAPPRRWATTTQCARQRAFNRGAELGEGTFWSNTFRPCGRKNYVISSPNERDASSSPRRLHHRDEHRFRRRQASGGSRALQVMSRASTARPAMDMLNGAPLGTVMTDGVLRVASASNAIGFPRGRHSHPPVPGAGDGSPPTRPFLHCRRQSGALLPLRHLPPTYDFNARRSIETNAARLYDGLLGGRRPPESI